MDWISAKTQRPKLGQEVLCFYCGTRYDKSTYSGFRVLSYMKYRCDNRKRVFSDRHYLWEDLNIGETNWPVTHWILLEKPKQD